MFDEIKMWIFNEISPLYKAVEKRNIEMVKLLLSSGKVDVNIKKKGIWFWKFGFNFKLKDKIKLF